MHKWQTGVVAILVSTGLAPSGQAGAADRSGRSAPGRQSATNIVPNAGSDFDTPETSRKIIQEFDARLKKNPRDFISLYYRGRAYSNLPDSAKALADWNRSLSVNPYKEGMQKADVVRNHLHRAAIFWGLCYQSRGYLYFKQGKFREGIEDTSKAIAINPDYPLNYRNRALAYKRLGRLDLADMDLLKYRQLTQTNAGAETTGFPFDRPD
jgi:tetratricopeptide (TPR) repeat protein